MNRPSEVSCTLLEDFMYLKGLFDPAIHKKLNRNELAEKRRQEEMIIDYLNEYEIEMKCPI
jgi:hypothetical protein